ncbi:MAG: hypothetical protein WA091_03665 [Minisyncoccales bacterium]|jgi:hypothetical protein
MTASKKSLKINYFLACEGYTEYIIFSYLKNRFRDDFLKSNINFSDKANIIQGGIDIISNGVMDGIGDKANFKSKYNIIKEKYQGGIFFFLLDDDLDDSSEIKKIIEKGGDFSQFIKHNSEYLLLRLSGYELKEPMEFKVSKKFRDYCKEEFSKKFGKKASRINDFDLDDIFRDTTDEEIKRIFNDLFSIL